MKRKSIIWIVILAMALLSSLRRNWAAAGDAQANDIINKHLAALGGTEELGKIHDYTMRGTARVSVMGQGFNGEFRFVMKVPTRWRETFTSPYYEGDSGCDGRHIWALGEGQLRKISQLQQEIELEFAGMKILAAPPRPGWTAQFLGKKTLSNKETLLVQLTAPSGRRAKYYFDAKTSFLLRSIVPAYDPMRRQETDGITDFQNYRPVGKLMLPHWVFNSNGFLSKEIEVSQWTFNTKPNDSMFAVPQVEKSEASTISTSSRGL